MSEEYTHYGIGGEKNLFAWPHCETDRFYRMTLHLTTERYMKEEQPNWNECRNAFVKPKRPA